MLTTRNITAAAIAATFAFAALPPTAGARGGHGGTVGRMGMARSHALVPRALAPLASTPGGKQTGSTQPSQSQEAAAAATAAAASAPQSAISPATALPPSALAAPAAQAPAIAPLSPGPGEIIESSGGSPVRTDTVPSSSATSASPSESAPSTPGGGGDTMAACMGFWDAGTHMTKAEWRSACTRTLNRIDLASPLPLSTHQQHAGAVHRRHAMR